MILLDTDSFTLLTSRHPRVVARFAAATEEVAITVVTRIEALQGRFAFVLRAANGSELFRAQEWLQKTEADLARLPIVLFNDTAVAEFERLLENRKLRKIGRADLLIASIALSNRATLVTRNVKDFRQVPGLTIENWAD
ncbi:MAG TPA: type II toxin-antitoxin system VapC family toxin [Gemmataceae bacterium]|nr:type II toxin-antitoxin system VapC family toxin [Gemmataceae bacterium]